MSKSKRPETPKPADGLSVKQIKLYWHYLKPVFKAEYGLKGGFNLFKAKELISAHRCLKRRLIREGYVAEADGLFILTETGRLFCKRCKNQYGMG